MAKEDEKPGPTQIPTVVLEKGMFFANMPGTGIFRYEGNVYRALLKVQGNTPSWSAFEEIYRSRQYDMLASDKCMDQDTESGCCAGGNFIPCPQGFKTLCVAKTSEDPDFSKLRELFEQTRARLNPEN